MCIRVIKLSLFQDIENSTKSQECMKQHSRMCLACTLLCLVIYFKMAAWTIWNYFGRINLGREEIRMYHLNNSILV